MIDHRNLYIKFLKRFLQLEKRLKVVFDCSDGTAGQILKSLFKTIGPLKVYLINERPDGNFPAHGPDPLAPGALKQVQEAVLRRRADLGVIFDADGDRAFFVDDIGRLVDPDIVVYLLIWQLRPKKAIVDVRTGWLVKKQPKTKILASKAGYFFIRKLMRRQKAEFAAERSGHYYFQKIFYLGDALLATIFMLNAVSRLPYRLSHFVDFLPKLYRSGEINFKLKKPERLFAVLKQKFEKSATRISQLDGLTMEFNPPAGGWWFNLRPSHTEALVRLNMEAVSQSALRGKVRLLKKMVDTAK